MASVRIEFVRVVQNNPPISNGPDNVIQDVLLAQDITTTGTAQASSACPVGANAVRVTAIGGAAYVNPRTVATAIDSLRHADGQTEVYAAQQGKTVSVMTATS